MKTSRLLITTAAILAIAAPAASASPAMDPATARPHKPQASTPATHRRPQGAAQHAAVPGQPRPVRARRPAGGPHGHRQRLPGRVRPARPHDPARHRLGMLAARPDPLLHGRSTGARRRASPETPQAPTQAPAVVPSRRGRLPSRPYDRAIRPGEEEQP